MHCKRFNIAYTMTDTEIGFERLVLAGTMENVNKLQQLDDSYAWY